MLEKILRTIKGLVPRSIFNALQPFYHFGLGWLGAVCYGYPSRRLTVIGVTGTNGKSTVVAMLDRILNEAGLKTASVSSLRFKIGDREWKNALKMTMPGRWVLQKFLKRALREGATHAVVEVTSEGIRQFRHKNIKWDALVLTNVTPEHIESHGGFENYRAMKLRLFFLPHRISVVNIDDESAAMFLEGSAADAKYGYGIAGHGTYLPSRARLSGKVEAYDVKVSGADISFAVDGERFFLPLIGEFNVYNALAAVACARALGVASGKIKSALSRMKTVAGRMEFINEGQPFRAVVDYAHTPDSLEKVYETLRDTAPRGGKSKMICVLGSAGGGRDKWKRSEFGKIAASFCDTVILTNEDPYDEDPLCILDEIEKGFAAAGKTTSAAQGFYKILDRREAIKKAAESAGQGDTVIVTGKGAEPIMMGPKGSRIPWDDREELRRALRSRS